MRVGVCSRHMHRPPYTLQFAAAILLLGVGTAARAQSVPQLLAQSCGTLSAAQLLLTTGNPVAAGSSIVLGIATDSNGVAGISVADALQSRYFGAGGYQDPSNRLALVLLRAPLERPLPSGSQIAINFASAGNTIISCAQAYAASGVGFSGLVNDTLGSTSSTATPGSPAVNGTTSTAAVPELVFAVMASDQSLGTANSPASLISSQCNTDVCITGAAYTSSSGGVSSIGFSGGSQTKWLGALGAFYDDDIFGNGFN